MKTVENNKNFMIIWEQTMKVMGTVLKRAHEPESNT